MALNKTLNIKKLMESINNVVFHCRKEIFPWEKEEDSKEPNAALRFTVEDTDGTEVEFAVFANHIFVKVEDIVVKLDDIDYGDLSDVEKLFALTHVATCETQILQAVKEARANNTGFRDKIKKQLNTEMAALEFELMKRYEGIDINGRFDDFQISITNGEATVNGESPMDIAMEDPSTAASLADNKDDLLAAIDKAIEGAHDGVQEAFELMLKALGADTKVEEESDDDDDDDEEISEEDIKAAAKEAAEAVVSIINEVAAKKQAEEEAKAEKEEEPSNEEKAEKLAEKIKRKRGRKSKKDSEDDKKSEE